MRQAKFRYGVDTGPFEFGPKRGGQTGPEATPAVASVGTTEVEVAYSDEVVAELLYMIEEEKLAGDVYETFYDIYGLKIFASIGASEDRHFDALVSQADAMGIDTDQFVFAETGSFDDPELQELYDTLIETGSASLTSALEVGAAIETKDIVDIAAAMEDVEGTVLAGVYANLLAGSENHLVAFEGLLG
ncbi:DUF2202 domain-containing protein [Antarctobacter sp.]|uniref:DUF2202 domain-containing protein n=1 Tax=Antarctobacter sp. TaxID=1872577 RepID=UPI002B26AF10|nr:DUF2202 domain-containing protein [Antarctobacter sp.]